MAPRLANGQAVQSIQSGEIGLLVDDGTVKIEQDINSLVTYTEKVGKVFHKNRIIRLCSTIANDLKQQFSDNYIGQVNNNEEGRNMFKAAIVSYLLDLQAEQAIQNFDSEDITVEPGEDIDAILVTLSIYVVDAVEKIYVQVTVS